MKRIQSIPAARPRKTLARSAVLLALALAAPAPAKTLAPGVLFEVTYAYDSLGRPASRTVNGELQTFEYDGRDRLVAVRAEDGSDLERYRYDAAGNILEKTVRGETTRFVYDAANQLVSRTDGSGTTAFAYDAAGRLVREGDRRFVYDNDGHVSQVLEGGAVVASFDYFLDGQVAAVHARGLTERFLWDGLAMVARGDRTFLNEPAATGGNPVASMGRSFLNDMLGSTVGVHDRKARTRTAVSMTLFGETDADEAYFTGKPELPELGYAFLVRSYRADLGKWQTRDPLGYPDGWNAMAYCNCLFTVAVDSIGAFLNITYSISTHTLSYSITTTTSSGTTTTPVSTSKVKSGDGIHQDNPASQAIVEKGPIPVGDYYICERESGGTLGGISDWITGRDQWFALYADDGTIDDFTTVGGVSRGRFRLHPGTTSHGCITMLDSTEFTSLRNALLATSTITISGTTLTAYGKVTVVE